jgi:hypothetical protein
MRAQALFVLCAVLTASTVAADSRVPYEVHVYVPVEDDNGRVYRGAKALYGDDAPGKIFLTRASPKQMADFLKKVAAGEFKVGRDGKAGLEAIVIEKLYLNAHGGEGDSIVIDLNTLENGEFAGLQDAFVSGAELHFHSCQVNKPENTMKEFYYTELLGKTFLPDGKGKVWVPVWGYVDMPLIPSIQGSPGGYRYYENGELFTVDKNDKIPIAKEVERQRERGARMASFVKKKRRYIELAGERKNAEAVDSLWAKAEPMLQAQDLKSAMQAEELMDIRMAKRFRLIKDAVIKYHVLEAP